MDQPPTKPALSKTDLRRGRVARAGRADAATAPAEQSLLFGEPQPESPDSNAERTGKNPPDRE